MSFIESKKKRPGSFRHIWPNLGRYRIWTLAAAIFGGLEVMLEVLIPMLMSVIVVASTGSRISCCASCFRRHLSQTATASF